MRHLCLLAALLTQAGCSTLQEHPYATSFAVAFVAGSIVATENQRHGGQSALAAPAMAHTGTPSCVGNSCQ